MILYKYNKNEHFFPKIKRKGVEFNPCTCTHIHTYVIYIYIHKSFRKGNDTVHEPRSFNYFSFVRFYDCVGYISCFSVLCVHRKRIHANNRETECCIV